MPRGGSAIATATVCQRIGHDGGMTHLRYAGLPFATQYQAVQTIIAGQPELMRILGVLRDRALPDAWITSGAIYNIVWNHLTDRPALTGIKDVDIIYFDPDDLSYAAEDAVIRDIGAALGDIDLPLEIRNQARVHLWFPERFGFAYPQLTHATQSLDYYASKTHAVAARLAPDGGIEIAAPFGLEFLFAFRMVPNHALDNRVTHAEKGTRAQAIWPELTVEPW